MEEQWVTSVPLSQGWRDGERVRERTGGKRREYNCILEKKREVVKKQREKTEKKRQRIKKDRVREREDEKEEAQ